MGTSWEGRTRDFHAGDQVLLPFSPLGVWAQNPVMSVGFLADGGGALGWEVPCKWLNKIRRPCNAFCRRDCEEVSLLPGGTAVPHFSLCPRGSVGTESLAVPRSSVRPVSHPPSPGPVLGMRGAWRGKEPPSASEAPFPFRSIEDPGVS